MFTVQAHALALVHADPACTYCLGRGERRRAVCRCVWRAVFREVWMRYQVTAQNRAAMNHSASLEMSSEGSISVGLPNAEFLADVELTAKRVLAGPLRRLWQGYFLEGRDWREMAQELGLDRGRWWHAVYRTMALVGAGAFEYGIYPFERYFGARRLEIVRQLDGCGFAKRTPRRMFAALRAAA